MRWISIIIPIFLGLSFAQTANASSSMEAACQSLNRSNIDCQCAAKRVETFQHYAPSPKAKDMIAQTYLYSLGLEHDLDASLKATFGDPIDDMERLKLEMSFDPLGGTPSNIEDLESGCIIQGAALTPIKLPRSVKGAENFSETDYIDRCMVSLGTHDTGRRSCQCTAERLTHRLTDPEFEAYFRSFGQTIQGSTRSDGTRNSLEDDNQVQARSMGLSLSAYKNLLKSASKKLSTYEDRDSNYCSALQWPDQREGQSPEQRLLAGFEPNVLIVSGQAKTSTTGVDLKSGSKSDQATAILTKDCSDNGNSDEYCGCYIREFKSRIVSASPNEDTTLAYALMTGGGALPQLDYVTAIQSVPQSAHQSAAMLNMQHSDLGETCTQGEAPSSAPMDGTPAERMTAICIKENESQAMCQCMTSKLQGRLSPDDFELIVDIREADAQGASDPLAKVAADRGLTAKEAEQAMAMNQSMMSGIMGMDMMSCMGGMPGMPGMPNGMPDMSKFPGMPD